MKRVESLQNKILSGIDLERWLTIARFKKHKIVFTSGNFDLLHEGHIRFLAEASEKGNHLVVALSTDASVRKRKGDNRPFLDQESRAIILAALHFVSVIVLVDDEEIPELIRLIQPDILAESTDQEGNGTVAGEVVKRFGGKILTLDSADGYSTADIANRLTTG